MAVHIEVPGDFGQSELNAVKIRGENDLTSQAGILLKHGCHVEHVILPGDGNMCQLLPRSRAYRKDSAANVPLFRFWKLVEMGRVHIDVAC